jgi:hypothetical protein
MRAVLIARALGTGLLLSLSAGAFGQTGTGQTATGQTGTLPPAASVAQSIAKVQESQIGADVARRPTLLAGSGQRALVLMHGWGPTYAPTRPEEIPILAAPDVPTTGFYPWSKTYGAPRTWPILSIQSPCWKC